MILVGMSQRKAIAWLQFAAKHSPQTICDVTPCQSRMGTAASVGRQDIAAATPPPAPTPSALTATPLSVPGKRHRRKQRQRDAAGDDSPSAVATSPTAAPPGAQAAVTAALDAAQQARDDEKDMNERLNAVLSGAVSTGGVVDARGLRLKKLGHAALLPMQESVHSIDLSENGLKELPGTICLCSALSTLRLKHNMLSTLPESFGDLLSLQHLDLSHNDLKVIPDCITGLVRLRTLFVNNNGATALPDGIGSLTALQHLNAAANQLTKLPPSLCLLPSLEQLDISYNMLPTLPGDFWKLNPSLNLLHAEGNDLQCLPPEFQLLSRLQGLFLRGNKLDPLPAMTMLARMPNLVNLGLRSSGVHEFPSTFTGDDRLLEARKKYDEEVEKDKKGRRKKATKKPAPVVKREPRKRGVMFVEREGVPSPDAAAADAPPDDDDEIAKAMKSDDDTSGDSGDDILQLNAVVSSTASKPTLTGVTEIGATGGAGGAAVSEDEELGGRPRRRSSVAEIEGNDWMSLMSAVSGDGPGGNLSIGQAETGEALCGLDPSLHIASADGSAPPTRSGVARRSAAAKSAHTAFLPRLKVLSMSHSRIDALPPAFGGFSSLTDLNLAGNMLTELPVFFGHLPQLRFLDVSFNKLRGLPDSIGKMRKLEVFNVSENLIHSVPKTIGRLQQLRVLDLSRNELRKLPRQLPERCVLLRQFHLHSNPPMVGLPLSLPNLELLSDFTCDDRHLDPVFYTSYKDEAKEKVGKLFEFVGRFKENKAPKKGKK